MATIDFIDFKGMRPARSPKLLGSDYAVVSINAHMETGAIGPDYGLSVDATLSKSGTLATLYRHNDLWFSWTQTVNVARIPIESNTLERVAFTGAAATPRATDSVKAIVGTDYPDTSYILGVPAPTDILVGAASSSATAGALQVQWDIEGTVDDAESGYVARVYTYTYLTPWGEEGPPADPSDIVYVGADDDVELSNFAGQPAGAYQTMTINVYRSSGGGAYLYVANIAIGADPWTDTVDDTDLGDALTTATWSPPPDGLLGITTMANGIMAGFVGNDLYFSEPYQGHAWPEDYKKTVDFPIVGLAASGNMLSVMTEGYPYIATGNHPTVISLNKLKRIPSCVSARSIVDMGSGALYASNEGLVAITSTGAKVISKDVIDQRFWRLLNPSTMHGHFYKGRYVGFYAADAAISPPDSATAEALPRYGHFQLDLEKGTMFFSDETCTGGFSDMETADLYLCQDDAGTNKVYQWDGNSSSPLTMVWRSGTKVTKVVNIDAARVDARAYPVTFRLYVAGVLKHTEAVADRNPFRMPGGYRDRDWAVEIEGTSIVDGVFLAPSISDLT